MIIASLIVIVSGHCDAASICFSPHRNSNDGPRAWAYETGVAAITSNSIDDILGGSIDRAHGAAGGQIYHLTVSRRIGELQLQIGDSTFTPQVEVPLTLEIVDENSRSPFWDLNLSFTVRWVDFPWNDHVKTTFAMGLGLSYSSKIYLIDFETHPGEDRSKLKFNWPIEFTFALPDYPDHQVKLYISHQSGGHIFDKGGVNSIGIGYRWDF